MPPRVPHIIVFTWISHVNLVHTLHGGTVVTPMAQGEGDGRSKSQASDIRVVWVLLSCWIGAKCKTQWRLGRSQARPEASRWVFCPPLFLLGWGPDQAASGRLERNPPADTFRQQGTRCLLREPEPMSQTRCLPASDNESEGRWEAD